MRDFLLGAMTGYSEAAEEKNKSLLQNEIARRKSLAEFWKAQSEAPDVRPEARDIATQKYHTILQTPYEKKMPKGIEGLDDFLKPIPQQPKGETTPAVPSPYGSALPNLLEPMPPPELDVASLGPRYNQTEQQQMAGQALRQKTGIETEALGQRYEAQEAAQAKYREPKPPPDIDPLSPRGIAAEEEKKRRGLGTYALKPDSSLSETELAMKAAGGDVQAQKAMELLTKMKNAGNVEPGQYVTVTDGRGVVTGFVNPKTQKVIRMEELGLEGENFRGAMAMDRQVREQAAASGLRAITKFREELKKNPKLLAQLAVPGSVGARTAAAARAEMVDVLTRIRTGAALNQNEESFYQGQAPSLLDQLFNDPGTIDYKLSIFENNFKALAPPARKTNGPNPPPTGTQPETGGTVMMEFTIGGRKERRNVPADKVKLFPEGRVVNQ